MSEITLSGRPISPGLACGPLVRNHARLPPGDARGGILVAERAVPDDLARLRAAAGTLTLGGAVLSHVGLLSRELGKPSVALAADERIRVPPRGRTVLRATVGATGSRPIALAAGDVVVLDGDGGLVRVPGGRSRAHRRAIRETLDALRSGHGPGAVDLADETIASFAVEAVTVHRELASRADRQAWVRRAATALGESRWASAAGTLARRSSERLEAWCRGTRGTVRGVEDPGELRRLERELQGRIEEARRVFDELGLASRVISSEPAALLETLAGRRKRLTASLDASIENALAWSPAEQKARAGRLYELWRRARAAEPPPARLEGLSAALGRARPGGIDLSSAPLVVSLAPEHADPELCGGKAAGLCGLGPLLPERCSVPPGFVVTTAAYRMHLLGEAGDRLRRARWAAEDTRSLSRLARAAIWSTSLPEEVSAAILAALAELPADRLAVRASSPLEGGAAGSLAGLFDTFLGVRGVDEVIERVRRAWASSWDTPVLDALRSVGELPEEPAVAVLVQRMIETRVAGVMLTRSPSGAPDTVLINACRGLGEGIRGGEIEGDLYTVRRGTGELVDRRVGVQAFEITLDPERPGTIERPLGTPPGDRRCLDDARLARLAELARRLDASTGRSQDVEFGFDEADRLWIFQLRRAAGRRAVESPHPGPDRG